MKIPVALTYDDVLLVPQRASGVSRGDPAISTATSVAGIPLDVPILSANMDTITGVAMAGAMSKAGGAGVLHRYMSHSHMLSCVTVLRASGAVAIPSVGVKGDHGQQDIARVAQMVSDYASVGANAVCVDVAHAHSDLVCDLVRCIVDTVEIPVIAGNVATYDAALALAEAGAKAVKVGIGPGAVCTTRSVTGHGMPQLTAVMDAALAKAKFPALSVIADGGIKDSGDIVKALAVGADAVMSGYLFAGADEALSHSEYRGMASARARAATPGGVPAQYRQEGVSARVEPKGSVDAIMRSLAWGIRSGFSYSGATDIATLRTKATLVRVTQQGQTENATRL